MQKNKAKKTNPKHRIWWIVCGASVVAAIVVVSIVLLSGKASPNGGDSSGGLLDSSSESADPYGRDILSTGYYFLGDVLPQLSDKRITAIINEMYYTNNGSLCVKMTLGNGSSQAVKADTISVQIINGYTQKVIAEISDQAVISSVGDVVVPSGGTFGYTLYIEPVNILDKYDLLDAVTYKINVAGKTSAE